MQKESDKISRRSFLSRSGAAATGVSVLGTSALSSTKARASLHSANEQINVAVMGINSRGKSLIENFAKMDNVMVKTLCDPDETIYEERIKLAMEHQKLRPGTEKDIRRVLEDKEIDAVAIAAPNHWHALGTIWACQAGKHVYCEKPSSHGVWEGRKMIEAARRYNRIVQIGYQNRSRGKTMKAMKFLHDGGICKVYMARGMCYKPRKDIGKPANAPVPAGLDYDLWLGPAGYRPFNPNYVHYNWHWHWAFGNGDTGNQGPHQFDIARWGLNRDDAPVKVSSKGGYYVYDSTQETPNVQTSLMEYDDGTLLQFETRGLMTNGEFGEHGTTIGNFFYGSDGILEIDSGGNWKTFFGRKYEPGPGSDSNDSSDEEYDPMNLAGSGGGGHFANFISAVRAQNQNLLACDVEVGHKSSVLPHISNIAYRVGRELRFDGLAERFIDDDEANSHLKRDYRSPYVIPERV